MKKSVQRVGLDSLKLALPVKKKEKWITATPVDLLIIAHLLALKIRKEKECQSNNACEDLGCNDSWFDLLTTKDSERLLSVLLGPSNDAGLITLLNFFDCTTFCFRDS